MISFGKPPKSEPKMGLGKGGDSEDDSPKRAYAKEMFAALQDDDEEGFVSAALALHACEMGEEEEESDDDEEY